MISHACVAAMYFGRLYDAKLGHSSACRILELEPERTLQVTCVADNRGNLAHLRIADGCDSDIQTADG